MSTMITIERAAQIAEAAYGVRRPKWWHSAEQRDRFRKVIADATAEGLIAECPACHGAGCRGCDWRGVIMPGVNW